MAMPETVSPTPYRISGHESFPCRYTWLPKAVRAWINGGSKAFR